jgi:hypothetical protein
MKYLIIGPLLRRRKIKIFWFSLLYWGFYYLFLYPTWKKCAYFSVFNFWFCVLKAMNYYSKNTTLWSLKRL